MSDKKLKPLYKYTKRQYADSMMKEGKFYINTLDELREFEHSEIGDEGEGTKTIFSDPISFDTSRPESLGVVPQFVNLECIFGGNGCVKVINSTFKSRDFSNFFVFSTSTMHDRSIMEKMNKDYDACVEIIEPDYFFSEITATLYRDSLIDTKQHLFNGDLKFMGGECNYKINREENYKSMSKVNPTLIKPKRFSYQKEFRIIWVPVASDVRHKIIICSNATQYLKRLI